MFAIELIHRELADGILTVFFDVDNIPGYGFLEKVYHQAMHHKLMFRGYEVASQKPIKVNYKNFALCEYYANLVVNDSVIIQLKACEFITPEPEAQLINYLQATPVEVGLLLNFGHKPDFRRRIFDNSCKSFQAKA